ncbi:MAG: hypothetical protein KAS66_00180 [Candidatus Omnitrophica bacterium]|nr:hypothetical protein [Candidatus Omnitrophota bacterium]
MERYRLIDARNVKVMMNQNKYKKVEVNSMNLIDRLKTYKETKKLSKDDLFIELRAADVPVSMITLTNWLSNKNEPSQMYRKALENFLAGADNDK